MAENWRVGSLDLMAELRSRADENFLNLAEAIVTQSYPAGYVPNRPWENAARNGDVSDPSLAVADSEEVSDIEIMNVESVTPPTLPPRTPLYRPPVKVGKVHIVKKLDSRRNIWCKAMLLTMIYNVRKAETNNRALVKYGDGNVSHRHMQQSEMAYLDVCPSLIPLGTGVVTNAISTVTANYYAGIVLEEPSTFNHFRYLVFLEKGTVFYAHHDDLRVICDIYQPTTSTIDRYFLRDYLNFYPDRFMLKFKIGEKVEVKKKNEWKKGEVRSVDCSIVQLQFSDGLVEWYCRGSYRIKKVIYGDHSRSHPQKYLQRLRHIRGKIEAEINEERADDSSPTQNTLSELAKQVVPTGSLPASSSRKLQTTDPIVTLTPRLLWWPKDLGDHLCSPSCVPGKEILERIDPKYGVLVWPLCTGFKRLNQSGIIYKAPCGVILRSWGQLKRYMEATKLSLTYEHFDFSSSINVKRAFQLSPNNILASLDDITKGLEPSPIPCVNELNNQLPEEITYITSRGFFEKRGHVLNNDGDFLSCCSCEDGCQDPAKCECIQLTINSYLEINEKDKPLAPSDILYQYKRLFHEVRSGIYECNQRCKCCSDCPNRLVQNPISAKLQLFQTGKKGWGVRALHDLPKGSFVCTYVGLLLDEFEANEWGTLHGDQYLSDLDFIEKQESYKPGYEETVSEFEFLSSTGVPITKSVDLQERLQPKTDNSERAPSTKSGDHLERTQPKTDDREQTAIITSGELDTRSQPENNVNDQPKRRRSLRGHPQPPFEMKKRRIAKKNEVVREYPKQSIKWFYPVNCAEFTIDAKDTGNIGRYFNHACEPNMFVQNVFVDTHDLRFPWVAFFTLHDVVAGTELTWDYGYSIGSVVGKRLYCYCLNTHCKRRLY